MTYDLPGGKEVFYLKFLKSFHLYAFFTIVFWSMAYVFTRALLRHFSVYALAYLRFLISAAAMLVLVLTVRLKLPAKRDLPWFFLSGAVGFFVYTIVFNLGTSMVTAATSSIVIATSPILTALLASFLFREQLGRLQWAAAALEFVGILMLTLGGDSFSLNPGVLWLLLGSLLLSVYNILQRRLTRSYSPLCCSAYAIFFGTLLLSVFAPESFPQLASATALDWVYLLLLGVLSGSVAHLCWAKAMALAEDTSSVSNYMFLTPLFTALLGIAVVQEIPDLSTLGGGCIVMLGMLLFNCGRRKPQAESSVSPGETVS